MADVLSQSQIDALLKSMASAPAEPEPAKAAEQPKAAEAKKQEKVQKREEKKYNKYDFYSPRKFTKEKIRLLKSIFENYARILTSQINGIFRTMTDITVLELRETRYYEYANSFHENDCMTLVDTYVKEKGKNNVPMMIFLTPGLTLTLVNHMLGGADTVVKVQEDYRYSDVETALYRRIMEYIVHALGDGFSNYISADFKIQRVEENPTMVQEVGLDETVVIIVLNVDVSGLAAEKVRFCLPGTLLEHMFKIIDNRKHLARGFAYENNELTIMEHLRTSEFTLTGQLSVVKLDISDLFHLKVGDVIDLNKPKTSPVKLFVGKQPWFTGKMGVYKKNIAIRIEDRIMQKTIETEESTGGWDSDETIEAAIEREKSQKKRDLDLLQNA